MEWRGGRLGALGLVVGLAAVGCIGCGGDAASGGSAPGSRDAAGGVDADVGVGAGTGLTDASDATDATEREVGIDAGGRSAKEFFEALSDFEEALEASPDHLPAEAQRLVADEDPEGLFELVRDRIAVVPDDGRSPTNLVSRVRWGPRATLRAGLGTARENADLLAELLERAGYTAEVVGPWRGGEGEEPTPETLREMFWEPVEVGFELDASDEQLATWEETFEPAAGGSAGGGSSERSTEMVADTLTDRLEEVLPPTLGTASHPLETDSGLPLVRVELPEGSRVVNPLLPGAEFGDDYATGSLSAAPEPEGMLDVSFRLAFEDPGRAGEWTPVLEREWRADEIAGADLELAFRSHTATEQRAAAEIGNVDAYAPKLVTRRGAVGPWEGERETVSGSPFTTDGFVVEQQEGELSTGLGRVDPEGPESDRAPSDIELFVDARSYPCVDLKANVRDGGGDRLAGLSAESFRLSEGGEPRAATLRSNTVDEPRILFLIDTYRWTAQEFTTAETVEQLASLGESIRDQYPEAAFAIAHAQDVDETFEVGWRTAAGEWTTDIGQTIDEAGGYTTLDPWTTLTQVQQVDPSAVVMLTAARTSTSPSRAQRAAMRRAAPLMLAVGGNLNTVAMNALEGDAMATTVQAEAVDEIEPELSAFLERALTDYRWTYEARPDAGRERTLELTAGGADGASGTVDYRVPAAEEKLECLGSIRRMRMTVEGGERRVDRVVAEPSDQDAYPRRISEAPTVTELLAGRTTLQVEADTPPPAVWLREYVGRMLDNRAAREGLVGGGAEEILAAIDELETAAGGALARQARPAAPERTSGEARSYPTGLRVGVSTRWLDSQTGEAARHFEQLPVTDVETFFDPGAAPALEPRADWALEGDLGDATGAHDLQAGGPAPTFASPGQVGESALELDGDDYFFAEDLVYETPGGVDDFAICSWVRLPDEQAGGTIFAVGDNAYYRLRISEYRQLQFELVSGDGYSAVADGGDVTVSEWHHVCGNYDAEEGRASVYVDGQFVDERSYFRWEDPGVGTGEPRVAVVGSHAETGQAGDRGHEEDADNFVGRLDQVRLYDRKLADAHIAALASQSEPIDPGVEGMRRNLRGRTLEATREARQFAPEWLADATATGTTPATRLFGLDLTVLPTGDREPAEAFSAVGSEEAARWSERLDGYEDWHIVAPWTGQLVAFWAIDEATGRVRFVAPGGSTRHDAADPVVGEFGLRRDDLAYVAWPQLATLRGAPEPDGAVDRHLSPLSVVFDEPFATRGTRLARWTPAIRRGVTRSQFCSDVSRLGPTLEGAPESLRGPIEDLLTVGTAARCPAAVAP